MDQVIYNLAFDFGASSGRAILSKFDGDKIELEEIYRFPNEPVRMGGNFYWDFLRLFHELKNGLKKAAMKKVKISSIGVDTWGVDYGLIDKNDNLLSIPMHYRDSRTNNIIDDINKIVPYEDIYKITGIEYMPFNTLYQLYADYKYRPNILNEAKAVLLMPDLFSYFLTGKMKNEYTIASTTQMLDAKLKTWSHELLDKVNIPQNILQEIIKPGEVYGVLSKEIQEEVNLGEIPVVAVCGHDTASAVTGTPLDEENNVFLSSGTWSLLGMEIDRPIINELSLKYKFTNEGGAEDKITFLRNINGTYILQQLKVSWSENYVKVDFPDIINEAKLKKNKKFSIKPNYQDFMAPLNMAETIEKYCVNNGQGKPEGLGEIAIAVYNGLAEEYKNSVENLEIVTGKKINKINIIGGGIKDKFLCQLTANATKKQVTAGPIEAAAFGNSIMQFIATEYIANIQAGRKIIKNSVVQENYYPELEGNK
jgi:rhamnulokinase